MKRTYLLIFIGILILPTNTRANPFSFYLTPKISMNYPSSKALRDYNDCNAVLMYGGEVKILHHPYHIGLYFQYQQYSFKIDDNNYASNTFKEKGSRFSFGLIKEQKLSMLSIYAKIGMTFYSDKLGFLEEDKKRKGIQLGLGVHRNINSFFDICFDLTYDYNKLYVPEYKAVIYSRHQAYLSGKKFNTGGFQFQFGFKFKLF